MRTGVALIGAGMIAAMSVTVAGCGSTTATVSSRDGTVAAAGVATKAAGTAHLTLTVSLKGKTVAAEGDADLATNAFRITLTTPGLVGEEVLVKHLLYLQLASLSAELPAGKNWVSENLDTITKAEFGVPLTQLSSSNPLGAVDELGSSSGISRKGTATIDGVPCTHYAGTIALSKVAATEPNAATRAALLKVASQLHGTFGIEVWVGPGDLIYQLKESLPSTSAGSVTLPAYSAQIDLSHFGEMVRIAAPPPSTVQDETKSAIAELTSGSST